mmetsp:Transcript_13680/g.24525  ORF Transcript_13680/g.24525 Transcript_13680/m.24525 type:complete len:396 (-) Transcript_13680:475-1662(-)|eukprot:CAMPEP_0182443980 /NCGR_PEP_ID=MMETSP1172-20130603/2578_1 /TAXON_ID=708627 /ORGANISM="Timspurckia oligopyrenoides, Strain CCMP3278" /LENGTH=395 /DNA_ID=CAMNT_0024639423 /DNA_START=537 /DNA_END=1724 /DNA_ORIENTATION=-
MKDDREELQAELALAREKLQALTDLLHEQEKVLRRYHSELDELRANLETRDAELIATEEYLSILKARLRSSSISVECAPPEIKPLISYSESDFAERFAWVKQTKLFVEPEEIIFDTKLGSGATGDVYSAIWLKTRVAVKLIKPQDQIQDRVLAEKLPSDLWREISALSFLRHPNILPLLGVVYQNLTMQPKDDTKSRSYSLGLVFPLISESLDLEWTSKSQSRFLHVASGISQAMAFAHRRKVIHRDLKPDNIRMQGFDPLVGDWGLSRIWNPESDGVLTGETGSYNWMAPEVLRYEKYNESCDVYSFGIVLWNLAHGKQRPYPFLTPLQVAKGVAKNGLRPEISSVAKNSEYKKLMVRCWDENPKNRPPFDEICVFLDIIQADANLHRQKSWFG